MIAKYCSKCGDTKPVSSFHKNRSQRDGLQTNCKACMRPVMKTWYLENADRILATRRSVYQPTLRRRQTPEGARDLKRDRDRRRRARKNAAFVEDVNSLVLLERDDGICGICGEDVDPFDFSIDHVIPLARGGKHSYSNTQVAHLRCNISKGARIAPIFSSPAVNQQMTA